MDYFVTLFIHVSDDDADIDKLIDKSFEKTEYEDAKPQICLVGIDGVTGFDGQTVEDVEKAYKRHLKKLPKEW